MSDLFTKYNTIIEAANNYRQNPNLYYTLKDYIFRKICYVLSKNSSALKEDQKAIFDKGLNEFKSESANFNQSNLMTKDQYILFLENFYAKIDFDTINSFMLHVCKDLTEVLEMYGPIDDLFKRRSNILL